MKILSDNTIFMQLWQLALPYLDTRENETHTRISLHLVIDLLNSEGGQSEVVIPAVILHDVGWKKIPEELQLKAFGPGASLPELNRAHESEGVKIARRLLRQVSYERSPCCEILAIIDGHDSRSRALTQNDALVKDADKLWRYTREGFRIDTKRFGETFNSGIDRLSDHLDGWLLTNSGKKMAADLLSELRKQKSELS